MSTDSFESLQTAIDAVFERRLELTAHQKQQLMPHLEVGLAALDSGRIRACDFDGANSPTVQAWVKKLIILYFMLSSCRCYGGPDTAMAYDKMPLKFEHWTEQDFAANGLRIVPGAVVRRGAYLAPGVVLMPSFVNVGAYIGPSTMIDTWATVGSCAQIGARCHISGGAGIGGVLEPIGNTPVVIEDHVFIGARSEIAEGVRVGRGAVIGMGVYIGNSTPIIDRATGKVHFGKVPEDAVVIPGSKIDAESGIATYAAVIVKYADQKTRGKTALNYDVRPRS